MRTLSIVFGTFAVALLVCFGMARAAPLSLDLRYAVAHFLLIPAWVTSLTLAFALFGRSRGRGQHHTKTESSS